MRAKICWKYIDYKPLTKSRKWLYYNVIGGRFMKKIIAVLLLVSNYLFAQEGYVFSDNGLVSLDDQNYHLNIVLVNDLRQAITVWDTADTIPGIPSARTVKIDGGISTFISFVSLNNENVNLTYSVKLKYPNGNFSSNEYNDLIIARGNIRRNLFFRGRQLLTISFDETDALGKYQFYITIKDGGKIIKNCIMEFELLE
jgi:hypothetical protein